MKSTLIIRDSQAYHYGKYNCTVVNDYGNDVAEIQLQAKSEYIFILLLRNLSQLASILTYVPVFPLCSPFQRASPC